MTWHHFIYFAIAAALLWIVGAVEAWRNKKAWAVAATTAGLVVFFAFIFLRILALHGGKYIMDRRDWEQAGRIFFSWRQGKNLRDGP